MLRTTCHRTLVACVYLLIGSPRLSSQESHWRAAPAGEGDWFDTSNWTGGVPNLTRLAHVDNGGTAVIANASARTKSLFVGLENAGKLIVQSGTLEMNDEASGLGTAQIVIGSRAESDGQVELRGGTLLHVGAIIVGQRGQGLLRQSGVSVQAGGMILGAEDSGSGELQLEGGTLRLPALRVGNLNATGHVVQISGEVQLGGAGVGEPFLMGSTSVVEPGANPGSLYEIRSGLLEVGFDKTGGLGSGILELGFAGSALFKQEGGRVRGHEVLVGRRDTTGKTMWEIKGGSLEADVILLGDKAGPDPGIGAMSQTGGEVRAGEITVGGGSWTQRDGMVSVERDVRIGHSLREASWQLLGGELNASQIFVGHPDGFRNYTGRFNLQGGRLTTRSLRIADDFGTSESFCFIAGNGMTITVTEVLSFGVLADYAALPGTTIRLDGASIQNKAVSGHALRGLNDTTVLFATQSTRISELEVASQDLGAVSEGFTENFALNEVIVGDKESTARLRLVDTAQNSSPDKPRSKEALYVKRLYLSNGAELDLNGIRLYYLRIDDRGASVILNEGELIAVKAGCENDPSSCVAFHRGDSNSDGRLNLSDATHLIVYSLLAGPSPTCARAADSNDDDRLDISDGIFLLNYLFRQGPPPPDPGPSPAPCGPGPLQLRLDCASYAACGG